MQQISGLPNCHVLVGVDQRDVADDAGGLRRMQSCAYQTAAADDFHFAFQPHVSSLISLPWPVFITWSVTACTGVRNPFFR